MVGTLALGTRAMHLDGLADTVDGLGSGWDRARALEVMRRGDIGPMGVVALVIILGLQAASIGWLADDLSGALLVGLVVCCSRAALTLVCRRGVPAARTEGLGAAVAGSVPWPAALLVWLLVASSWDWPAAVGQRTAERGTGRGDGRGAGALFVRRCVRRFGGVTGDVMGAAVEIALTSCWSASRSERPRYRCSGRPATTRVTSSLTAAMAWLASPSRSVKIRPERCSATSPQPTSSVTATARPGWPARPPPGRPDGHRNCPARPATAVPGADPVDHRGQPGA